MQSNLVKFNLYDLCIQRPFHFSYTLLLKLPVLMHFDSKYMYTMDYIATVQVNFIFLLA